MPSSKSVNFIKAARNLLNGSSMAPLRSFYDSRYPPTKFILPGTDKIHIKCLLCGFPRSGTHWIRNVIEKSTSEFTGDLGRKKPTPEHKNVILVKIHARSKRIARAKALWLLPRHTFDGKYIYTYRDPRDAIISLYEMYRHKKNAKALTPQEFVKQHDPIGQYRWEINSWVLAAPKDVLLIPFEQLRQDPIAQFKEVFTYLGLEGEPSPEIIDTRVSKHDGTNRPRGKVAGWKNASSQYDWLIDTINKELKSEINRLGYENA